MQTALKLAYVKPARKAEITTKELLEYLKGKRITLDCGHHFTIHHFSLTMIVYNDGQTNCHN